MIIYPNDPEVGDSVRIKVDSVSYGDKNIKFHGKVGRVIKIINDGFGTNFVIEMPDGSEFSAHTEFETVTKITEEEYETGCLIDG